MHAALAKIENIRISDAKTNASSYLRYVKDPESIVAVVLALSNHLHCFFKSLTAIWLTLLKNKEFCSNYCRKRDHIFRTLETF